LLACFPFIPVRKSYTSQIFSACFAKSGRPKVKTRHRVKIKVVLQEEAEQIRKVFKEKQAQDKEKIERLSRQVSSLRTELNKVKRTTIRNGLTGLYTREALDRFLTTIIERSTLDPRLFRY
jgi:hypothetical protein